MATAVTPKTNDVSQENRTVYHVLFIISLCHMLNDTVQSVVPAMFPILEEANHFTYTQLGFIAFTLNLTSSLMQPVVGLVIDKRPFPYALPIGLLASMIGVLGLAFAPSFVWMIISVFFIGIGSAVFHPEGSRVSFLAAGTRRGLAQSIYQVGGNSGQAFAPLITALVLVPLGQFGAIWFTVAAGLAVFLLLYIAKWYSAKIQSLPLHTKRSKANKQSSTNKKMIISALTLLVLLVFARSWYLSAISNFYTFFAIEQFGATIKQSQGYIFLFLVTGAIGTFFGGPLSDKIGRKNVIFLSMILATPLAIYLPFAGKISAYFILAFMGFILLSSFSVTVVYAQELLPGKIGTVSGLIVGLAFGMGAIGSVALGYFADHFGIVTTITAVGFLPLLGLLSFYLPSDEKLKETM
ncbi:MFS transporter [Bacillus suaedaesalsae]|uniref:MFS transporter n=1 Tax=Bacillus suaedaesalsae TaxID=2810349 RepID=A0ABS2DI75_9BACI|nr:MFS transporter [Bacillus suaedaesalsae]MBM6618091.1 MFS transporter [Bacillus suaedaesalsae]